MDPRAELTGPLSGRPAVDLPPGGDADPAGDRPPAIPAYATVPPAVQGAGALVTVADVGVRRAVLEVPSRRGRPQ
ncbi:hypothetical protein GCM10009799_38940 [Nocardiopsis rhodophaea]|uniref:Uncharacterized protein n=1 Tax=Nocardiopsis rhodophaea TaxID=280238 RepID=A0ABN2TF95_9ACTN